MRKFLETKLCCKNLIKGINTWPVVMVRYLGLFLKWTSEELRLIDQRTRKLMTMHEALHLRDESRKGEFTNIEDCVDASIQKLECYIKNNKERLITAVAT